MAGASRTSVGVSGYSDTSSGVVGTTESGNGIWGISNGSRRAGRFSGLVTVAGDVRVTGTLFATQKAFRIDHPLDPQNRYLTHATVESPEIKTVYDGIAVLDDSGEATVTMPEWFEALNTDFRYQLTAIGTPATGLYIAKEVEHNQFAIGGGIPGMKVSWQVTGVRQDEWPRLTPSWWNRRKRPRRASAILTLILARGWMELLVSRV